MRYAYKYVNVFNYLATKTTNAGQSLFRSYVLCLKRNLAELYNYKDTTCAEIDRVGKESFVSCMIGGGMCNSLTNNRNYADLWVRFVNEHDVRDPYIYALLRSLLIEAKKCGSTEYRMLVRQWRGRVDELSGISTAGKEELLKFLEEK